nr:hypothetical protein [Tanacetum cinerariifolium]
MGDYHHKPITIMVQLWWLLWLQPARSPPQRWRQMAEHSEAPLGVAPPQPDTTWCGCTITRDRKIYKLHRDGGGQSAIHSPPRAAATGKAADVAVVPAVMVDLCEAVAVGVVGGAWRHWVVAPAVDGL